MKRDGKVNIPEVVGQRIKALIDQQNLLQRDVAYDAGIDVENLRKYIKGQQEMKISTLLRIAKALKIQPGLLVDNISTER